MALQIAAMIVGLLLVGGAALWGLNGLHRDYGVALRGYEELRSVYEIGSHLATARTLLAAPFPDVPRAAAEVEAARTRLGISTAPRDGVAAGPSGPPAAPHLWAGALGASLDRTLDRLRGTGGAGRPSAAEAAGALNDAIARLGRIASDIRGDIEASQAAADRRLRATTIAVAAVCAAVVAGAVLLGAWQYRGVMRPLNRLAAGVRRVAAGRFAERIEPAGAGGGGSAANGDEFARLAADFNRMAAELDGFYRELERKVAEKSKELIRSERLASVGYLAAGVAHEINNPLGIITGYAELSLAQLKEEKGSAAAAGRNGRSAEDVAKTLRIICDEAFRCKEITGRLLSLARPGDEGRTPVDLARVASAVASIVGGLRQFGDRRVSVTAARGGGDPIVLAVEAEMRQVVTNLLLNALEAVEPGTGRVSIDVAREGDRVRLTVSDNGRGMTPETTERVFEPFYTEHRGTSAAADAPTAAGDGGPRRRGTGLGLSITHAIVQSHGGRITAHSDGPGKGSRFVIDLPAAAAGPGAAAGRAEVAR